MLWLLLSRWRYYVRSFFTILLGFRNPIRPLAVLLGFPPPIPFKVSLRSSPLQFLVRDFMDIWILKETCLDGEYDRILPNREGNGVLLDIGAGIGDFSIRFSNRFPGWRILAYEPLAESFDLLEKNVGLNRIEAIECVKAAVSSQSGSCFLYAGPWGPVSATTLRPGEVDTRHPTETVDCIGLDEIVAGIEPNKEVLLKIDCEGAEFEILLNAAPETLGRIAAVALEFHDDLTPHSHEILKQRLEANGFEVEERNSPAQAHRGLLFGRRR